jgi:hypothetical protein
MDPENSRGFLIRELGKTIFSFSVIPHSVAYFSLDKINATEETWYITENLLNFIEFNNAIVTRQPKPKDRIQ